LLALVAVAPAGAAIAIGTGLIRGDSGAARATLGANAIAALIALAALGSGADPLGGSVAVAFALLALIVAGYSARALQGSSIPYRRFFTVLGIATAGALSVAVATDLRVLAVAWIVTGLATSALLATAARRPAARRWAGRHLAVEAIGDVAWLVVLVVVERAYGTFDLRELTHAIAPSAAATTVALALVVAGAARSALVPLHAWLPNSMEAPTPVSAFMHAGLVNGAGVLLAKCAAIVVVAPAALTLAAILGGATVLTAATITLVRPEAKRRLGWSTVAQMGFMVVQCACGAFAAAIVHLITHGGYKATAFLRVAGTIDAHKRAGAIDARTSAMHPLVATAIALLVPSLGVIVAYALLGAALAALPAALAVVALAWMTAVSATRASTEYALDLPARLLTLGATALGVPVYLAAVVALDAFIGRGLPQMTFVPVTMTVAVVAVIAGIIAASGFRAARFPGADAAYALALVEGRAVPVPAR
jgi:NAD(P)H-quinone oxidoreductase subunit 5